jgi:nitrogen fixation/metabolism regulation signal transduction histidine kinase
MAKRIRGSGLRYTLPFLFRFAGMWLVVTVTAVLVTAVISYLRFAHRDDAAAADLRNALLLQTILSLIAVVGLAVFTTHRLAGPWIAIKRALDSVRDGDLRTGLRLRGSDPQNLPVQVAFEQMLESLRKRIPDAEPPAPGG